MSSPNDRRLYAFEAKGRYGVLASFMGEHLDRKLIEANWDEQYLGLDVGKIGLGAVILDRLDCPHESLASPLVTRATRSS
jgi:hypothetical protein